MENNRVFWMAFCNDGVPLFDIERASRAEAIKDLKEAFRADCGESEEAAAYNDYYIEKYTETDDEVICHGPVLFKMSMGPRGGVRCEETRAI